MDAPTLDGISVPKWKCWLPLKRMGASRTAQANQIRGLVGEFGLIIPQGIGHIGKRVPQLLEDASNELPGTFRQLIDRLTRHLKELDLRVKELERQIIDWHRGSELSRKLEKIPGIGPLAASALVASIADANSFKNGRQVSAWLGLVPRQHSSGGKATLLGMSKRGDAYLRTLLIHGARSAIRVAQLKTRNTNIWLANLLKSTASEYCCRSAGQQERTYRVGDDGTRARVQSGLHIEGRDSIDTAVTNNASQARRSHHRLLRRSRSDAKAGKTVAGQTQYFRRTASAKNRLGASQPIPSGTAARAAAKVRMYGCNLSLQALMN
jgi:hypothetical protein